MPGFQGWWDGSICQETGFLRHHYCKSLVTNTLLDGSVRDKAFRTLRRWLQGRCMDLTDKEYLCLWKALFYCIYRAIIILLMWWLLGMWMADKVKYQQNLAQQLGDIWIDLHKVSPAAGLTYAAAFWQTICREWTKIDRLRY